MLTPEYEIITSDRGGANRWTHPRASATEPIRYEINAAGSFTCEIPANDPGHLAGYLEPWKRELQVWRLGKRIWWGPIIDASVDEDMETVTVASKGLLEYFAHRYVGNAQINNLLSNGSFDSGALSPWTAVGVQADIVTQWGYLPGTTYQLNLYQGGAGEDTFAQQITTVPGGAYWTLSGWFHIRQDAEWVGPAYENRGLYIERRHPDTNAVEDVQYFAITSDTPRGIFQRATVNMWSPPGRNSIFVVRLYATRCTNPTPSGGRPPGGIIWDQIKLVAMESLSYSQYDMGEIINQLVTHAQDPTYGKSSLDITPFAPTTGRILDRTYQLVEHRNILEAINEFAEMGLCDFQVEYDSDDVDNIERWFAVYAPQSGVQKEDIALEEGARATIEKITGIDRDGSKVVTTPIVMGEGSGPDREQDSASDTSGTNGLVLEEILTPSDVATPSFDLLRGIAQKRIAESGRVAPVPRFVLSPQMHGRIGIGDRVKVIVPSLNMAGWYRIVALEVDPNTDRLAVEVNAVA